MTEGSHAWTLAWQSVDFVVASVVRATAADDLSGHWSGPVTQIDAKPYSVKLTITRNTGT
jgi:hypothetical protein